LVGWAARNNHLQTWVDEPGTVRQNCWVKAFAMAQKAGTDTLFRIVRKTLPQLADPAKKRKQNTDPADRAANPTQNTKKMK
jgi:hypothetical protein